MKDMFNMTTRSKYIINIPALKESIPNSSDWYSRVGFSFINLSLLSSKLDANWFPEKRGEWTGNGAETMGQLLTCSVASVSCQRRPSWETEMKTCSSQLWFHGLTSGKSIHKTSDRLWFADRSRLYLILNKNWHVHSLTTLIILMFFNISKQHLHAIINESQNPLISFHTISGWLKKFQQ
jgi:hypothetical protein